MWNQWVINGCLCAVFALSSARGGVLFSETFSYPNGPLVTVANGRWKTHSGTAEQVEVISGELKLSQKKSEDVSAPIQVNAAAMSAVYAAFKVRFSALPTGSNGAYFAHFKDGAATTGLRCRIFATTNGAAGGSFRIGVAAAASKASVFFPGDLQLQKSYRIVSRMTLANNASTLWLNPRTESDPSVTAVDEASPKAALAFALRQSLASGSGMGELAIDDLVISTTFAETRMAGEPVILKQPESLVISAGDHATFAVEASGEEPLFYQWFYNGSVLNNGSGAELELRNVSEQDAGAYHVVVSNNAGSAQSDPATLTVQPVALALQISCERSSSIRLCWQADPTQTYSVFAAERATDPLMLVATGLYFPEGAGIYGEDISGVARFYRIQSP